MGVVFGGGNFGVPVTPEGGTQAPRNSSPGARGRATARREPWRGAEHRAQSWGAGDPVSTDGAAADPEELRCPWLHQHDVRCSPVTARSSGVGARAF